MVRIISFLLMLAMVVQIIKPLGLPGLKKRGDFWKIAIFAFAITLLVIFIRPE